MKIHRTLRELFDAQLHVNRELEQRVEKAISRIRDKKWHFEARTKSLESYAVKVESGLVKDPSELEDFLACALVVPNLSDIAEAEARVLRHFERIERRPESSTLTRKQSQSFPFDDVRLYLRFRVDDTTPPQESDRTIFELQIRTFLQHAWTVATHDVVYKTDQLSWPRERVAHQVKAILEHAELAVDSLEALEKSESIPQHFVRYDDINKVIEILRSDWTEDELPADLKRVAIAMLDTFGAVTRGSVTDLRDLLTKGRERHGGTHNVDWSPYRALVEYLAEAHSKELARYARRNDKRKRKICLYRETLSTLGITEDEIVGVALI